MIALRSRTTEEGLAKHRNIPVRVYEGEAYHGPRIERTREWVKRCAPFEKLIELGCGTGDISGPFKGIGWDINELAIAKARERFPQAEFGVASITEVPPEECDVLVLCEVLEHLADPMGLVTAWLPLAKHAIISFPVNESELFKDGIDLSAGEHQWSFTRQDLDDFITKGGHEIVEWEQYPLGTYRCIIARTKKK